MSGAARVSALAAASHHEEMKSFKFSSWYSYIGGSSAHTVNGCGFGLEVNGSWFGPQVQRSCLLMRPSQQGS
jgi:hypothetical protein